MNQTDYLKELINSANDFPLLHNESNNRRKEWINVIPKIVDALNIIVENLQKNDFFKSNIYLINEDAGDYKYNSSVYVKSGQTQVEEALYEEGFQVHFQPTINGRLHCHAFGFNLSGQTLANHFEIEIVELENINAVEIYRLFLNAFQQVRETSFYFEK